MYKKYYFGNNLASLNQQDLKSGYRVLQIVGDFSFTSPVLDGPFDNIQQLKKKSSIFKEAIKKEPKRVQKILLSDNFIKIKDFALVKPESPKPKDFLRTIEHIIKGDIRKKKLYGIHFYKPERMKIIEITGSEDLYGIWKAVIEVYDIQSKIWLRKETHLFPRNWDLTRLFSECDYAYRKRIKKKNSSFIYESYTTSGIPVEIIIKNSELKTIYPVYGMENNIR